MPTNRFEWRHPEYDSNVGKWVRQRDCIEGEDAIKAKGVVYLPPLSGQHDAVVPAGKSAAPSVVTYSDYKNRASFLNATGRTVSGLVGLVTRKKTNFTGIEGTESWMATLTREGAPFSELVQTVLSETVGVGRFGVLVDLPVNTNGRTVNPYASEYTAEHITDWNTVLDNDGNEVLNYLVLTEPYWTANAQNSGREKKLRYRVCTLQEAGSSFSDRPGGTMPENPVYMQRVYLPSTNNTFVGQPVQIPAGVGGRTLDHIPFTFFNPLSTKARTERPPLLDLTVVNLSHFRNSADLEHGAHFTALPQPWAAGFNFNNTNLFIGSAYAWVSEEPEARAGYMEFTGKGLGFLQELMEIKKREMAAMGARLLEEQTPAGNAEATATVALRMSGERSVLARVSLAVSQGLTKVIKDIMFLRGEESDDVRVILNNKFGTEGMTSDQLNALSTAVIDGLISYDTFFYNLKNAELIEEDVTKEEELSRIQSGGPDLSRLPVDDNVTPTVE